MTLREGETEWYVEICKVGKEGEKRAGMGVKESRGSPRLRGSTSGCADSAQSDENALEFHLGKDY